MLLHRLAAFTAAVMCAALLPVLVAAPASAAVKRTVSLSGPAWSSTAGKAMVSGRVKSTPKGTRVLIQRRVGSRWTPVSTTRTTTKRGAFRKQVALPSVARGTVVRFRAVAKRARIGKKTYGTAVSKVIGIKRDQRQAIGPSGSVDTFVVTPGRGVAGRSHTVYGQFGISSGSRLELWSTDNEPWLKFAETTTMAGGTFSITFVTFATGVREYLLTARNPSTGLEKQIMIQITFDPAPEA